MPLFRCTQCGCVENTATGAYWWRKHKAKPVLCSECDSGQWHGLFPKKDATGMVVDENGFLWSTHEQAPDHIAIAGIMQADGTVAASKGEKG
ncbi:hypothetical protein [Cupriavidus gilardii]|uniref:hypothetical protein n=1 Tax=Cupriavidus gilardii TaxID=82541 RepID=UPI0021C077CE|nr:hypothetical protein [Cupriavidus gilardii]MCT9125364.1 hypothetical protein [Cupriavidus gilardii]